MYRKGGNEYGAREDVFIISRSETREAVTIGLLDLALGLKWVTCKAKFLSGRGE